VIFFPFRVSIDSQSLFVKNARWLRPIATVLNHIRSVTLNLIFADKKKGWQTFLVGNFGQQLTICLYVSTTFFVEHRIGFHKLSLDQCLTSNLTFFEMPRINLQAQKTLLITKQVLITYNTKL
jgi:hypothetical protein